MKGVRCSRSYYTKLHPSSLFSSKWRKTLALTDLLHRHHRRRRVVFYLFPTFYFTFNFHQQHSVRGWYHWTERHSYVYLWSEGVSVCICTDIRDLWFFIRRMSVLDLSTDGSHPYVPDLLFSFRVESDLVQTCL